MLDEGVRRSERRTGGDVALPRLVVAAAPFVGGLLGVAAVTLGIAILGTGELANASMLYLIVVLVAAVVAGRTVAIFSALLAFFSFNWFLTEPRHTLAVAEPDDWILLLLFLLTAIVTGQLAAGQRRRAEEAEEHERQARVLSDIAAALGEPSLERMLETVADRLRAELAVAVVEIDVHGATGRTRVTSGVGGDPDAAAALAATDRPVAILTTDPHRGRARWTRVAPTHRPRTIARSSHRVGRAAIRSPNGDEAGQIALVAVTDRAFDEAAARLLVAVTAQLWVALERARLRDEATEAEVLRRANDAKSALIDAVSHDLRTPLASIIASAGSLRHTDVPWSDDERAAFATAIEHEARRLDRIVGNLLDLSRIRAGTLEPDRAWYEPVALVRDVVARLAPLTAGHEVRLDLPDELPPVAMDYSEIDQVLTNLLENAVRHAPRGSTIGVGAAVRDGSLEIRVEDSGPGLGAVDLARLFDSFYRAPGSPRSGSGLGLAVARGLVEAHGGSIRAEPRREGGSRFAFTLPMGDEA